MDKEKQLRLPKFWILYLLGAIFFIVEIVEGLMMPSSSNEETYIWSYLFGIGSYIYWWVCVYKLHTVIRNFDASYPITPGKAVGFNFIPIYNIYWFFKWPAEVTKFLKTKNPQLRIWKGTAGIGMFAAIVIGRTFDGALALIIFAVIGQFFSRNIAKIIESDEEADECPSRV